MGQDTGKALTVRGSRFADFASRLEKLVRTVVHFPNAITFFVNHVKLRLQYNSIRFRLKRSEVEQFARNGRVEEKINLGTGDDEIFRYVLESTGAVSTPRAVLTPRAVIVQVPPDTVVRWASTDQIGIEGEQGVDNQTSLRILIEKDFACIDGTDEQNADTFPNPLVEECKLSEILPGRASSR